MAVPPWGQGTLVPKCFGLWSRREGTLQGKSCPSRDSREQKVALAALQVQGAAGSPSLVTQSPSAELLLLITDLESLHRSTQLMPHQ